jgi:hypothetical protein
MLGGVQGMTDAGREVVAPMVLGAWDAFLALAEASDLQAASRLPGWRAHEVCVHLGTWPEHDALAAVVADARAGRTQRPATADEVNDVLTRAHREASAGEVLAALHRARANAASYFDSADLDLDALPTASVLGPLPVLGVLLAGTYELAVHALDLQPAGAPPPPDDLLLTGLAALADITGALAARLGLHGGAALHAPTGGWAFAADDGGWTVRRLGLERPHGAAVEAEAASLLDFSAGRINPMAAITRGHLRVHDLRGLMRLAPIVESVPDLPGGPALRVTARTLAGLSRVGLPGLPRR